MKVKPAHIIATVFFGIALGIFTIIVGVEVKSGLYIVSSVTPLLTALGLVSIALLLLGLFLMLRKEEPE